MRIFNNRKCACVCVRTDANSRNKRTTRETDRTSKSHRIETNYHLRHGALDRIYANDILIDEPTGWLHRPAGWRPPIATVYIFIQCSNIAFWLDVRSSARSSVRATIRSTCCASGIRIGKQFYTQSHSSERANVQRNVRHSVYADLSSDVCSEIVCKPTRNMQKTSPSKPLVFGFINYAYGQLKSKVVCVCVCGFDAGETTVPAVTNLLNMYIFRYAHSMGDDCFQTSRLRLTHRTGFSRYSPSFERTTLFGRAPKTVSDSNQNRSCKNSHIIIISDEHSTGP